MASNVGTGTDSRRNTYDSPAAINAAMAKMHNAFDTVVCPMDAQNRVIDAPSNTATNRHRPDRLSRSVGHGAFETP